jgi:hypothetical protein
MVMSILNRGKTDSRRCGGTARGKDLSASHHH